MLQMTAERGLRAEELVRVVRADLGDGLLYERGFVAFLEEVLCGFCQAVEVLFVF